MDLSTDPQLNDPQEEDALHRIVLSDSYAVTVQITITPKYNHLLPVVDPAFLHTSKSQL